MGSVPSVLPAHFTPDKMDAHLMQQPSPRNTAALKGHWQGLGGKHPAVLKMAIRKIMGDSMANTWNLSRLALCHRHNKCGPRSSKLLLLHSQFQANCLVELGTHVLNVMLGPTLPQLSADLLWSLGSQDLR